MRVLVQAHVDLVQALVALVALVPSHINLVQALVTHAQAHPPQGGFDMGGKETGCSGARIWVGWSCLVGVCERSEMETGLLLTGYAWVEG